MGQTIRKHTPNRFPSFKRSSQRQTSHAQNLSPRPSIFSTLRRAPVPKPSDFIPLFNDCISAASSRTQECLLFKDPEDKFRLIPEVLTQVGHFVVCLNLTDTFNCTAMTPEQRILLGADWVWALLEKPTKNPQIQIAVQTVLIAQKESSNKTMCERLVDFCTSIGKDCYALFLFMGKKNDPGNIYGVLSNNFESVTCVSVKNLKIKAYMSCHPS
uniref:Sb:cb470 n=1 Tax=Labrus bergylta TaxID=56723 RepID=A0A3Q3GZ63_9LABR